MLKRLMVDPGCHFFDGLSQLGNWQASRWMMVRRWATSLGVGDQVGEWTTNTSGCYCFVVLWFLTIVTKP